MGKVTLEDHGPFRVELEYDDDHDFDFSHYGEFCELPRSVNGQFDHSVHAGNDPKGGAFYMRNPTVWQKVPLGNGTDSWHRVRGASHYGWFKLAEHPRYEVEHLMKEEGLPEREAWHKTLARWPEIIEDLADGNISAIRINVEVFFNDELVGDRSLGGIEVRDYVHEDGAIALAREYEIINDALRAAEKKIEEICKTAMLADRPDGALNAA
jgi:hypothetical protein